MPETDPPNSNSSAFSLNNDQYAMDDIWAEFFPENEDDHEPLGCFQLLQQQQQQQQETLVGTSTLDREKSYIHGEGGGSNCGGGVYYSSSDCWSAASSFRARTAQEEKMKADLVRIQEPGNEVMDNSRKHHLSCDIRSLSSENDGDDLMSSESDGDEIQSKSTVNFNEVNFQVPQLGMAFSSEEEAYKFYKNYAKEIGFSVRKGKLQWLSNGTVRKRYFLCSRQGFKLKKQPKKTMKYNRKETRTGCDAMIQFTFEDGKWVISRFVTEHNHDLEGPSQRHIIGTPNNNPVDHSISMSFSVNKDGVVKEAGAADSVGFCDMDCRNQLHGEKTYSLQSEDCQSLIDYLKHLQLEDPSFFSTVQVDAKNRLTNFFWRDGRSKTDYDYFGDVLIVDTTYRIDMYNMICAPFLGLNHHRQYVLFGCAFLLDESVDSFIWLFRTFMEAMGRCQPKTIFTDECQAMAGAIEVVLPETQHRLDMWYVCQNARKHLFEVYGNHGFESLFNKCIFDCQSEEEFGSMWDSLLEQHNLRDNPWLKTLYMSREKWSHLFSKSSFSGGIQSNQGCESSPNVFQNLTSETMTLPKFVQHYLEVAEKWRREELNEDFRCNGSVPALILRSSAIEKQAANIYTSTMFKLFQEELLGCLSVAIEEFANDGTTAMFKITEESHKKENIVKFSCSDSKVTCSCRKYESVGILCVHALKVLNARNIFHIPPQYILKRWTKSAKDGMVTDDHKKEIANKSLRSLSTSKLMHKALNVITKSVAAEESRKIAEEYLDMALKGVQDVLKTKNLGHLNSKDVEVCHKGDGVDSNGIGYMKAQKMVINPPRVNQQGVSNHRTECQLKRKHENEVRERRSKSCDVAFAHHQSPEEVTKGGDNRGSKRRFGCSYSVGENSRQYASVSPRPPLPSQSTFHQCKDPSKPMDNMQARMECFQKEISKLRNENRRIMTRLMEFESHRNQVIKRNHPPPGEISTGTSHESVA